MSHFAPMKGLSSEIIRTFNSTLKMANVADFWQQFEIQG
jgi:hypothetical protein